MIRIKPWLDFFVKDYKQLMISPPLVAFYFIKLNVATMTGCHFLQAKFEGKMTTSPGRYFILLVLEGERTTSPLWI